MRRRPRLLMYTVRRRRRYAGGGGGGHRSIGALQLYGLGAKGTSPRFPLPPAQDDGYVPPPGGLMPDRDMMLLFFIAVIGITALVGFSKL